MEASDKVKLAGHDDFLKIEQKKAKGGGRADGGRWAAGARAARVARAARAAVAVATVARGEGSRATLAGTDRFLD